MKRFLLFALSLATLFPISTAQAVERQEGAYGNALDTLRGAMLVPADPVFTTLPLTVECRVKLFGTTAYNIIAANETKASGSHWELFTTPGDGTLHAYVPGRTPDHVHTSTAIADGQWHWLTMLMEEGRIRLMVDGVEKANTESTSTGAPGVSGPLAFGSLAEGGFNCNGVIDELRISKGLHTSPTVPQGELASDETTVGLWHFALDASGKDASPGKHDAQLRASQSTFLADGTEIPGGMPTALQALPLAEDPAPSRAAVLEVATRLPLHTVDAGAVPDAALREWLYDFVWMGKKEYPDQRPGESKPEKVKEEVYDPQSLMREEDGGPLGAVVRRTRALLANPAFSGGTDKTAAWGSDLQAIESARAMVAGDPEKSKALYLAACALRREVALRNPVLDFDSILCVARGSFEGSVRSNPSTADPQGGHFVTQYFGHNALPGGGLYVVRNYKTKPEIMDLLKDSVVENGPMKGQKLDHGGFATPDLSYDGKSIVFAWTGNKEHLWVYSKDTCFHLFKVNVDGTGLTQLTDGDVNDFSPCWLPNGRIAFVSERRGGYIRCFSAYLKVRSYTLFSMREDGTDISPLSYFETSEWNPSVNNEGQLVYTRWDYVDRENCLGTRFWISGVDGTNPRAPHGNYPLPYDTFPDHKPWEVRNGREWDSRFGAPLVEMDIHAVPNSPLYLFTAAPHHGEIYGSLCMLDLRQTDDHHMGQIKRITPEEPFPETETAGRRHYKYGTPWPLNEDFYLCNVWENMALIDRYGNKEVLCDLRSLPCAQDERLRIIDPIPLRARPRPENEPAPAPSTPAASRPKATIAVMNVYDSDLPLPEGVKIKWLRVVQNIPKTNHAMGEPLIGYERENTPRIPLGIVPVEEDGSAYFEAPVGKMLIFQALDDHHMAVQSMRSSAFVHPGEQLSCMGCHENPQRAAAPTASPIATRRAPSRLEPEIGPIEPISYYRQIKPIFDKTCVPCHKEKALGPQDMSYEALKEDYTFWFSGAMFTDMTTAYSGVHGGSRTIPGRFGARASKIGQALLTESHRTCVSPEDRLKVTVWLDSNSLRLGAYTREDKQLAGELVWPAMDVDPANPQGIDGSEPGLRHNFWHENLYGPFPILFSEHTHDRVAIMDKTGSIVWEYPVPHPQDVWMLPNGNILTTYYQGVREVTRDKQTVWEFTVEKPNEIPNCQPLPDGNVLIGIVGQCRLIEVNRKGEIVHEVQLQTTEKTAHAQFRMCRKTPEGTYVVPFTAEGAIREYDASGKVIREFPKQPMPVGVVRLDNGNTLISADGKVTEYDRNDKVVWQVLPHEIPDIQIGVLAGISRLDNGNTLVCNWNAQDKDRKVGAHLFEITDDKRVVWQISGPQVGQMAQCQVLAEDLARPAPSLK